MVFTTTVVNAHALSHLFDSSVTSIKDCKTCDDYVLNNHKDLNFDTPPLYEQITHTPLHHSSESLISSYIAFPRALRKTGKYYNKPPPFKLA